MNSVSNWITGLYDYVNQYLESEETQQKRKTIKKLKKRAQTVEDRFLNEFLDAEEKEILSKLPQSLPEPSFNIQPIIQQQFQIPETLRQEQVSQVEQYIKGKMNQMVLSTSDMVYFVNQINRYYELRYEDFTQEEIQQVSQFAIKEIYSLLLSLNKKLRLSKEGLYYQDDLNLFRLSFQKLDLNQIIVKAFVPDVQKDFLISDYFPSIELTNTFISTTKIFFQMEISEDQKMITLTPASMNFERSSLGSLLYFEYFFAKYKDLCFVSTNLNTILELSQEIHQKIASGKYSENDTRFIEMLYFLGYKNDYINCNWYVCELILHVINKYKIITGIVYNDNFDKYKRLQIQQDLEDKIKQCLNSTDRYILVPLHLIQKQWRGESHQNILLIDRLRKLVERFEPHGTISARQDKDLNFELVVFFLKFGLEYKVDLCNVSGVQDVELNLPEGLGGKCVSLSYGYLNHRLEERDTKSSKKRKNPEKVYPAEFAPIAYYNQINEKGVTHWIDIEDLNKNIFLVFQNYLDKINKIFGSSLYFNGNTLTFQTQTCKK